MIEAWHTRTSQFYHNHPSCAAATIVFADERVFGSGHKPFCPECERLHRKSAEWAARARYAPDLRG